MWDVLRIWTAMRLAKDVDTCCALLRGEPVDPSGLDQAELEWARTMRLVSLDVRAIDLFEPQLRRTVPGGEAWLVHGWAA